MPDYLFPGVYVEEVPFHAEPIAGVDTGATTDKTDWIATRRYRLRETHPGVAALRPEVEPKKAEGADIPKDVLAEIRNALTRLDAGKGVLALSSGGAERSKADCINGLVYVLRRDLYRIDLAPVVSKYIGETEKNLRRLFDVAERSGAILFFDEADALFGKRSEVNESHDRYANIEVGQLLDRLEEFTGIAVLASNSRSVIRDIEARGNVVLRLPPGKKRD
jgi:hypothetical protein